MSGRDWRFGRTHATLYRWLGGRLVGSVGLRGTLSAPLTTRSYEAPRLKIAATDHWGFRWSARGVAAIFVAGPLGFQ
jgi:hypothetical protein